MPTPVGHSLAGLAVWASRNKEKSIPDDNWLTWAILCVMVANLADFDFLVWTGDGLAYSDIYHHGYTHSVGFALFIGSITALWGWLRGYVHWVKASIVVTLSYGSHIVSDLFNFDGYPVNGIGLPALWPFYDGYMICPFMPPVSRSDPLTLTALYALSLEILLYGGVFATALLINKYRHRRQR